MGKAGDTLGSGNQLHRGRVQDHGPARILAGQVQEGLVDVHGDENAGIPAIRTGQGTAGTGYPVHEDGKMRYMMSAHHEHPDTGTGLPPSGHAYRFPPRDPGPFGSEPAHSRPHGHQKGRQCPRKSETDVRPDEGSRHPSGWMCGGRGYSGHPRPPWGTLSY